MQTIATETTARAIHVGRSPSAGRFRTAAAAAASAAPTVRPRTSHGSENTWPLAAIWASSKTNAYADTAGTARASTSGRSRSACRDLEAAVASSAPRARVTRATAIASTARTGNSPVISRRPRPLAAVAGSSARPGPRSERHADDAIQA